MSCRKLRPMFVLTFMLYGGLYHIVLRRLDLCEFVVLFELLAEGGSYVKLVLKLLRLSASLYRGAVSLNVCSLHESLLILLLMDWGSWRKIVGGWLERLLMYSGSSFGLRYGLYVPSVRLKVMSRKFTVFKLVCAVIFSPYPAKMLIRSFLALSPNLPEEVAMTPKPSSR